MSKAHKRRETTQPAAGRLWTAEDALLGTMPDKDVAERTAQTAGATRDRWYDFRNRNIDPSEL